MSIFYFIHFSLDEDYRHRLTQSILNNTGFISNPTTSDAVDAVDGTGVDAVDAEVGFDAVGAAAIDIDDDEAIAEADPGKSMWVESATKMLLALLDDMGPRVGKSLALKNKKKMWSVISDKLKAAGYLFSPSQVQSRFRTLERQYKKVKLNNSKTGRDRQTCSFEK